MKICKHCKFFRDKSRNYGKIDGEDDYKCQINPKHQPRPHRKACNDFVNKFRANEGDYCKIKKKKISKTFQGLFPCCNCNIRCIFSYNKKELNGIDYEK